MENNNQYNYDKDEYSKNDYNNIKEQYENNKIVPEKPFEKILGKLFLVWFIGSIIALVVFAEINPIYSIMVFGQYFLVFGIIALKNDKDGIIGVSFTTVGLACIVIPFLIMHPNLLSFEINWDYIIPVLGVLVFVIAGLAMIIIPILKRKKLEKVCTVSVTAKIVENLMTIDEGNKLYCPVYEFEFNGKKYNVTNNCYTNVGVSPVGTLIDMKINPNDPNEFLNKEPSSIILLIIGIMFLFISVPALIFVIVNGVG